MKTSLRGRERGQSLVEFAITLPILMLLFLGAFDLYVLVADLITANTSVREGSRLASVLAGQACSLTPLTQTDVDLAIVKDTLAVARDMNYYTPTDVYIYRPVAANGVFNAATDQYSHYRGDGTIAPTSNPFPLANRIQAVPNETSIGVELDWQYTAPTGFGAPTINNRSYGVFRALAVPSGC